MGRNINMERIAEILSRGITKFYALWDFFRHQIWIFRTFRLEIRDLRLAFNFKFYMRVTSRGINHSDTFYSLMTAARN